MTKTIEIKEENAIAAYNATDSNGKKLLSNLLGSTHFKKFTKIYEKFMVI